MLIDKIMDERKDKKSLKEKQAQAAKQRPENMTDAEWQAYVKKKAIDDVRKAGERLAEARGG